MKIVIYGKNRCKFCLLARQLLNSRGIAFEYFDVMQDESKIQMVREEWQKMNSPATVPAIWVDGKFIGGYDHLIEFLNELGK
jgi:glutaredoxin